MSFCAVVVGMLINKVSEGGVVRSHTYKHKHTPDSSWKTDREHTLHTVERSPFTTLTTSNHNIHSSLITTSTPHQSQHPPHQFTTSTYTSHQSQIHHLIQHNMSQCSLPTTNTSPYTTPTSHNTHPSPNHNTPSFATLTTR